MADPSTTLTEQQFIDAQINDTPMPELKARQPMTEEEFIRHQLEDDEKPPGVVTPVTPVGEPLQPKQPKLPTTLQGMINETVEPIYKFMGAEWQVGQAGMHEGEEGMLAKDGGQTYEEAEAHLQSDKTAVLGAEKRIEAFRATNAAFKAFSVIEPAAQALPLLSNLAAHYSAGFTGGAAAGATAAAIESAPTGEVVAPIAVPAQALANGALAGDAMVFIGMTRFASGSAYMKFRREGHSHEEANAWSTAEGLIQGALSSTRLIQAAGALRGAIGKAASGLMENAVTRYAATIGQQALLGGAQEAANLTIDAALARTSGKGEIPTLSESVARLSKAVKDSAIQAAAFGAATEGAVKLVKPWVVPKTVPQTLRVLKQAANNPEANLAELPEPKPPEPKPEPKLEAEAPKVDTRSKAEIERDDKREFLLSAHKEAAKVERKANANITGLERKLDNQRGYEPGPAVVNEALQKQIALEKAKLTGATEERERLEKEMVETEAEHNKIESKRLKALLAKTEAPTSGGAPDSRMARNTDAQYILDRVRHFVEDQGDAEKVVSTYDENTASEKQRIDYDAAKLVHDLEWQPSQQLRQIANDIKLVYQTGKQGRFHELAEAAEKRYQLVAEQRRFYQGDDTAKHVEEDIRNPPKNPIKKIVGGKLSPWGINFFGNWLQKQRFGGHDTNNQEPFIDKISAGKELTEAAHKVAENEKRLMDNLRAETGKTDYEINELLRKGAKQTLTIKLPYTSKIGETIAPRSATITLNQAMHKLAQWRDPEARTALYEGNGYREDTIRSIETQLNARDPAYVQMIDGYSKTRQQLYGQVNAKFREKTGVDLPRNPEYSGTMRHVGKNAVDQRQYEVDLESRSRFARSGVVSKTSSMRARTGDVSALEYEDIDAQFKRQNRQEQNYIALVDKSKEVWGPLMRDPVSKSILAQKTGGNALHKALRKDLEDILYGVVDRQNDVSDFLNATLYKNIAIYELATKPIMFGKHLLSVATAANHMPVEALVKGVADFYSDPWKNYAKISQVKEFTTRHGKSDINTAVTMQIPEERKHPFFNWLDHVSMAATIYGVKFTDAAILHAAEKHYMGKGLTREEALVKGGEVVHQTQVSSRVDTTSTLSRQAVGKFLTIFQGQQNNLAAEVFIKWDKWLHVGGADNFGAAVKASLINAASIAIFESTNAAYRGLFAKDSKESDQLWFDGITSPLLGLAPFISYPIIRDPGKAVAAELWNKITGSSFRTPEMSTLPGQVWENTMKLGHDILNPKEEESSLDTLLDYTIDINNAVGPWVGSPFKPPLDLLHRLVKLSEERYK